MRDGQPRFRATHTDRLRRQIAEMQKKWIRIDDAFEHDIIKRSVADCTKRRATDTIIAPTDPAMRSTPLRQ